MIRCANCDRPVEQGEALCPQCGAVQAKEQLILPEWGRPHKEWETLPARARLSWDVPPSVRTIHRLHRSGAFALSRMDLLALVRASVPLPTEAMSYGQVREWLVEHVDLLDDATCTVEVLRDEIGWTEAPVQPEFNQ